MICLASCACRGSGISKKRPSKLAWCDPLFKDECHELHDPPTIQLGRNRAKTGSTANHSAQACSSKTPEPHATHYHQHPGAHAAPVCADGEPPTTSSRWPVPCWPKGFRWMTASACAILNCKNIEPLKHDKIEVTLSKTDQRNHPERYAHLLDSQPLFDLSAGRIWTAISPAVPAAPLAAQRPHRAGQGQCNHRARRQQQTQWLLQLAVGVASGLPVADHWDIRRTWQRPGFLRKTMKMKFTASEKASPIT